MNRRPCYIGFLLCLVVLAAGFVPLTTIAQELSFVRGQKLAHTLSVCLDKQDAIAVLDADEKKGFAAASAIWEAASKCQTVTVVDGPTVGGVVKSAKVKRGDRTVTAKVVEIVHDGNVIGYFFTTATVDERNS